MSIADLLQLVETTCNKPVDDKFGQSICTKSVDNLEQTCRQQAVATRKPCDLILKSGCCNKLLQDVKRLVESCAFLAVYFNFSLYSVNLNESHFNLDDRWRVVLSGNEKQDYINASYIGVSSC